MIYITGDKHGDFYDIYSFCNKYKTSTKDIMIILGDSGINYYLNDRDYILKNISTYASFFDCNLGKYKELIPELNSMANGKNGNVAISILGKAGVLNENW